MPRVIALLAFELVVLLESLLELPGNMVTVIKAPKSIDTCIVDGSTLEDIRLALQIISDDFDFGSDLIADIRPCSYNGELQEGMYSVKALWKL